MNWEELGDAIYSLRNGVFAQMRASKGAKDHNAAAERTMVKTYLDELIRLKPDADPALAALHRDFPNQLTPGQVYTILEQMLRLWPEHQPGIIEGSVDPLDI